MGLTFAVSHLLALESSVPESCCNCYDFTWLQEARACLQRLIDNLLGLDVSTETDLLAERLSAQAES